MAMRTLTLLKNIPLVTYALLVIFVFGIAYLEFARAKQGGPIASHERVRNAKLYINLSVFFIYFSILFSVVLSDRELKSNVVYG